MSHPHYQVRINKAIDRLIFIDAIKKLPKLGTPLSDYSYYSLGGPFLEDFRVLSELSLGLKMVSIEMGDNTYKRQLFHKPCSSIKIRKKELGEFITQYRARGEHSVFWLDYTGLESAFIRQFMELLDKLTENSLLKITLRSKPNDYIDRRGDEPGERANAFKSDFGSFLPDIAEDLPWDEEGFAYLIQRMLRIAVEQVFAPGSLFVYQPITSFYYSDKTPMFDLTGIICSRGSETQVKSAFSDLVFTNFDWNHPAQIEIPNLSTKERLHLREFLPCISHPGRTLRKALKYDLDDDGYALTVDKLNQYAAYYKYSPYLVKAEP